MHSDKKNSLWLAIQYIIALVFSLISLKLNLNNYGDKTFGVWIILSSLWGFSSTIDFGFGIAIIKFVAQYKNEEDNVNKILSSVFFVFILLGLLIFIFCNSLAYYFYFNSTLIPLNQIESFKTVFLILGAAFLMQYFSIFFKSIIEGLNNFTVTSKVIIFQYTLILFGASILYYFDLEIIWLSLVYLITNSVIFCIYLIYYFSQIKVYSISFSLFELKEAKRIFKFSVSVQMMNIFYALIDPVVKYLMGSFYNIGAVTAYEIARRTASSISGLFFNTFRIILPKASVLKTDSEITSFVQNEIVKYTRIGLTYSGLTFGILSLPVIGIIYFTFEIKEVVTFFVILSLPETINNFGYAIYNFLLGIGKTVFLASLQFINLVIVVLSLFVGFSFFHSSIGLLGYFFSVLLGNILMLSYLNFRIKIPLSKYMAQIGIYKLVLLIVMILLTVVFLQITQINIFLLFFILNVTAFLVFYKDVSYYYSSIFVFLKTNYFNKNN